MPCIRAEEDAARKTAASLMGKAVMRRAAWAGLVAALLWPALAQTDTGLGANTAAFYAGLDRLIGQVRSDNPQLKAAGHKAEAATASAAYKKFLDPPQVGVDFYQTPASSFPDPVSKDGEIDYFIQQTLPFPGKLSTMSRAEQSRTEMLGADRAALEQTLVRDAKAAYFEIYFIDRKLQINAQDRELMQSFVAIAQKQYEVGTGKQSDILRGQTELSSLETGELVMRQQRQSLEAMLDALRNMPPDSSVPAIAEIEPARRAFTLEELLPLAEKHRPELKSMEYAVAMQENEYLAAKREFYPDFMVKGAYKQMMKTPDDWELMLGMTLPVAPWSYGKFKAGADRAALNRKQALEEYDNMKNMVRAQVEDALVKAQSARRRIGLYTTTVIPQARQTVQSTVAAYRTGNQDFLGLIDARRMLLSAQQDYHRAVADLLAAQAELEKAVGLPMDDIVRQSRLETIR